MLIQELLAYNNLLPYMITSRGGQESGYHVVEEILYIADRKLLIDAAYQLWGCRHTLEKTQRGRNVWNVLFNHASILFGDMEQ